MRTTVRTVGIAVAVVGGALLLASGHASASVPEMTDPYAVHSKTKFPASNPVVTEPVATPAPSEGEEQGAPPVSETPAEASDPAPAPAEAMAPEETAAVEAPVYPIPMSATPAPEQVVTRSATSVQAPPAEDPVPTGTARDARPTSRSKGFGAFLAEAASACRVGAASMSGGLGLVAALLGSALALTRHRIVPFRSVGDEEAREFLYAWDVIAPG